MTCEISYVSGPSIILARTRPLAVSALMLLGSSGIALLHRLLRVREARLASPADKARVQKSLFIVDVLLEPPAERTGSPL